MARLTVKHSVRFKAFTPAMMALLNGSYAAARETAEVNEVVVTSANDSQHSPHSRHYRNEALDFRTRNFPSDEVVREFRDRLKTWLGPKFSVMWESKGTPNSHIHVQVRKGTTFTEWEYE